MPTPDVDVDVAVIGAGPAGTAAALGLLAEGLRVALIDPGLPPAPRVESLPATGIALAESLGLGAALAGASLGRVASMRILWRAAPETRDFGAEGPLLLDKQGFHAGLRGALPDAAHLEGRVQRIEDRKDHLLLHLKRGNLRARFVIDARGRAALRAPAPKSGAMALGFSARLDGATRQPVMLLEALEAGWLWASLLPDGHLSGAFFLPAEALAGLTAPKRDALLRQHLGQSSLGLPSGLAAGSVVPAMLRAVEDPFVSADHLRIGDAALARDPIASHGLVHALRSGAQAAIAAATILDPKGQSDAARAFIRDRHAEAVSAATVATARSLSDQARFSTGFWQEKPDPLPQTAQSYPNLSQPLSLSPLRDAAELQGNRIAWTKAVWLPLSKIAATRFGPVSASMLTDLIGAAAPVAALSGRLEQALEPALATAILRQLLDEGALAESPQAQALTDADKRA